MCADADQVGADGQDGEVRRAAYDGHGLYDECVARVRREGGGWSVDFVWLDLGWEGGSFGFLGIATATADWDWEVDAGRV